MSPSENPLAFQGGWDNYLVAEKLFLDISDVLVGRLLKLRFLLLLVLADPELDAIDTNYKVEDTRETQSATA